MGVLEIDLQRDIEDFLDKNKIYHFRPISGSSSAGQPDVIACYKGRFVGLEVKVPKKGTAQGHQKAIRKLIQQSGGIDEFVRSVDEVKRILKKIDMDVEWER